MSLLAMIVPFIVVLGTVVFIHELGHFLVAKLLKIKVEVFSIGFGPRLLGLKLGETDYRLSAVPLGGYVKMKGENLDEEIEGTGDEFMARPKWQRFLVLFGGPAMNIVLAIAIPAVIAMVAFQIPSYLSQPAIVGSVALGSSAEQAGFQPGDVITKFADTVNPNWSQVSDLTLINPGHQITTTVLRNNEPKQLILVPSRLQIGSDTIGESGLLATDFKSSPLIIKDVQQHSPAATAGLKSGDVITKINDIPIVSFYWFKSSIKNFDNKEVKLEINRSGQFLTCSVTPQKDPDGEIRIGFIPDSPPPIPMTTHSKSFIDSIKYAFDENMRVLVMTKEAFAQMFSGQRNVKDSLAGPIGIAKIASQSYQLGGNEGVLRLMGLISLNLGVFNLLPIPVLDGGHIFIIFLEAMLGLIGFKITNGIKEKLMQTGFVILILLMGFVIYNDIAKTFINTKSNTTVTPSK